MRRAKTGQKFFVIVRCCAVVRELSSQVLERIHTVAHDNEAPSPFNSPSVRRVRQHFRAHDTLAPEPQRRDHNALLAEYRLELLRQLRQRREAMLTEPDAQLLPPAFTIDLWLTQLSRSSHCPTWSSKESNGPSFQARAPLGWRCRSGMTTHPVLSRSSRQGEMFPAWSSRAGAVCAVTMWSLLTIPPRTSGLNGGGYGWGIGHLAHRTTNRFSRN